MVERYALSNEVVEHEDSVMMSLAVSRASSRHAASLADELER